MLSDGLVVPVRFTVESDAIDLLESAVKRGLWGWDVPDVAEARNQVRGVGEFDLSEVGRLALNQDTAVVVMAESAGSEETTAKSIVLFDVLGERLGCLGGHLEQEVLVGPAVDGCEVSMPSPGMTFLASWAVRWFAGHGAVTVPVSGATDQAVASGDRGQCA